MEEVKGEQCFPQKKRTPPESDGVFLKGIGAAGFEPATTCSQSRCATRLRYTPKRIRLALGLALAKSENKISPFYSKKRSSFCTLKEAHIPPRALEEGEMPSLDD